MIRKFTDEEVLETFIETVREESSITLVEQETTIALSSALQSVITKAIQKVIKKASPDLSVSVQVDSIQDNLYRGTNTFEPLFNPDPSDVHFYITREAQPVFFKFNNEQTLTNTNISIDYYYPSSWTMTPPRDEEAAIRRTMDEVLFAWSVVSKTLSMPIIRFDDEEEAAEAVFAFANTLLFTRAVSDTYYYKTNFIRRLMYIQKAVKGSQLAYNKELATILYPQDKKIGQLEIPVATIQHNRLTQFAEGYLSCRGQERYTEYYKVLRVFRSDELEVGVEGFTEKDISDYLGCYVGQTPEDFRTYDMGRIQKVITNDDFRRAHPPMISTNFKGIQFSDVCPFTYGSSVFTYIHFEKDFVSHLEKTFKHLDVESAVEIARGLGLPKDDEINDGYDVDPSLIDLSLFHFDSREGNDVAIEAKTKEVYKNYGLYNAEEKAAEEAKEGAAVEVKYEPSDVDLLVDSLRSAELIRDGRLAHDMAQDVQNVQETIRNILWSNNEEENPF